MDPTTLAGISFERLRSFCQIVEAGSVVAAAKRNPVTQSQFSRQIRDLEKALGAKLFRREGKRLRLTSDGLRLAALTNAYFSALEDFGEDTIGKGRPILLAAAESVVRWVLAPRLPEVLLAAGAPLNVHTFKTNETVERLESGQVDVGILRDGATTEAIESLPFIRLRYALMAPRSRLPEKSAAGIEEVGAMPFVMLTGNGEFVRNVKRVAAKNNLSLQIAARVENFSLAVEAAKVLDAAVFVPVQAETEFPAERFARITIGGGQSLDRNFVVAYAKRTAEINTRARRFALRLSRTFEDSGVLIPSTGA